MCFRLIILCRLFTWFVGFGSVILIGDCGIGGSVDVGIDMVEESLPSSSLDEPEPPLCAVLAVEAEAEVDDDEPVDDDMVEPVLDAVDLVDGECIMDC